MKIKALTFLVEDMHMKTILLVQHHTKRRTIREAWEEEARPRLAKAKGIDAKDGIDVEIEINGRFNMIGCIQGLVLFMDKNIPLRQPTREEAKENV